MENELLNFIYDNRLTLVLLFWALFMLFGLIFLTQETQMEGEGDSIDDMSNPERVRLHLIEEQKNIELYNSIKFKLYLKKRIEERKV